MKDEHLGNEYHTYTLTWTDQEIKVALDGISYGTVHGGFRDSGIFNNITDASQWRLSDMSPFDREVNSYPCLVSNSEILHQIENFIH